VVEGFVFVSEKFLEFLEVFFPVPAIDGEGAAGLHWIDEQRGSSVALGLTEELRPDSVGGVFLAINIPELGADLEFPNDVNHDPQLSMTRNRTRKLEDSTITLQEYGVLQRFRKPR